MNKVFKPVKYLSILMIVIIISGSVAKFSKKSILV